MSRCHNSWVGRSLGREGRDAEKVKPGSDGTMTVKQTSASTPNRDGTASRCASSVSSKNVLGHPLVRTIGTE